MTFWLEKEWQVRAVSEIESALTGVHERLTGKGRNASAWTVEVLRALVLPARVLCGPHSVCGLKSPLDDQCKGEWLYDFCCWMEGDGPGEGFLGLPIVAESEWGAWHDIWDDLDKLTQARAGLRVLIFDARWAPPDCYEVMCQRIARFEPRLERDAWLFAGWREDGFEFRKVIQSA